MIQAYFIFFFQAEDGIRDLTVTGVQTCALPIYRRELVHRRRAKPGLTELQYRRHQFCVPADDAPDPCARSEEHTSELQSQSNLVCRLLLEKKKKKIHKYVPIPKSNRPTD